MSLIHLVSSDRSGTTTVFMCDNHSELLSTGKLPLMPLQIVTDFLPPFGLQRSRSFDVSVSLIEACRDIIHQL